MDRAEQAGVGVALVGHVALFGLLSVGFLATPNPMKIERNPIEVTFATDVGLEQTAERVSTAPPATSMAPELGVPEPAPASPAQGAPEPVPVPAPPKPTLAPSTKPVQAAKPVERVAAPKSSGAPKAAPAPKPAPVQRGARLGPDFLKGLTETASLSRVQMPAAPKAGGKVTAALQSELKRQLKPHWRPPSGVDVEKLRVAIRANLAPDGSIVGEPQVIGPTGVTDSNRAQADLFVERAVAAVRRAAPYALPKEYYSAWKTITPTLYEGL